MGCQHKYPTIRTSRPQTPNSLQHSSNIDINKIINPKVEENSESLAEEEINLEEIGRENPFFEAKEELTVNRENELIPFPGPLPELKIAKINLELSGISISNNKKLAIINHRILKLGDEIEGKKIIYIDLNKVILKDESGNEIKLFLNK